jgi:hypothetical protein
MADSPRRMMEKFLAFKAPLLTAKRHARYALGREDWLDLLRGSHTQAYFRDFILKLIEHGEDYGVDDTEVPRIIRGMMNTGYLWECFNYVKNQDRMARSIMVSFNSLQAAGFESTDENFLAVLKVIIDQPSFVLPFAAEGDNDRLHPLIVEKLITEPKASERLITLRRSGITNPLMALSLIDEEVVAPLVAGAL